VVRRGQKKKLPKKTRRETKKITGNLGRNQAQSLQPILRGEKENNNNNKRENIASGVGQE